MQYTGCVTGLPSPGVCTRCMRRGSDGHTSSLPAAGARALPELSSEVPRARARPAPQAVTYPCLIAPQAVTYPTRTAPQAVLSWLHVLRMEGARDRQPHRLARLARAAALGVSSARGQRARRSARSGRAAAARSARHTVCLPACSAHKAARGSNVPCSGPGPPVHVWLQGHALAAGTDNSNGGDA